MDKNKQGENKNPPQVVISILNWNGWQETLNCLQSVRQLRYPNYLVAVVDNGSRDESLLKLRAWAKDNYRDGEAFVEYSRETAIAGGDTAGEANLEDGGPKRRMVLIENRENLGFTTGNNVTIQYALRRSHAADYVLLLNNDTTIDEDCLTQLIAAGEKAQAGVVGAIIKARESGHVQFAGYEGSHPMLRCFFHPLLRLRPSAPNHPLGYRTSVWVSGAAMFIRREVLEEVRRATGCYLDDALFIYGDEADFCGRARKLGYESVMAHHAFVYHGESTSMGGRFNPLAYYYGTRNRVRVARNLLPWPVRPLFHGYNIVQCAGRVAFNYLHGRRESARAILQGAFDGYTGVVGRWKYHDRAAPKPTASEAYLRTPA